MKKLSINIQTNILCRKTLWQDTHIQTREGNIVNNTILLINEMCMQSNICFIIHFPLKNQHLFEISCLQQFLNIPINSRKSDLRKIGFQLRKNLICIQMMMITDFENSFLIGMNFRHQNSLKIKIRRIYFFVKKSQENYF